MLTGGAQSVNGIERPASISVLGVRITALTLNDLLERVDRAVHERTSLEVFYVNAHSMNVAADDPSFDTLLRSGDLVYCDGTGVRLAARLLGEPLPQRMTGADWIHDLARLCVAHGHSLYLLGGERGSAAEAAHALQRIHPGLRIAGTRDGYGWNQDTIAAIRAVQPDILLVGMGTPRQERWIEEHHTETGVPVAWAVGALFDFASGRLRRGPHWMTDHGLEWLCRLAVEPRKLWRRYLIGNPRFLWRVLRARAALHGRS
jgi:N-acetylglucosaminyldiphosphoundecaprenol N-acetyl-beta-D-mannosaminyltransferase